MKNNKKILTDVLLNIFATLVCSIVLNFYVFPKLANIYNEVDNGNMLTIYGIISIGISALGNTLTSVRLLMNKNNDEKMLANGDFNIIILILSSIGSLFIFIITYLAFDNTPITIIFILLTSFIGIYRAYLIVSYRIELNFVKQLISNGFLAIGYILGVFFARDIKYWPVPFLMGESLSLLFSLFASKVTREPFRISKNFKKVTKVFVLLCLTNLIGASISYLDRFLINPLLGAENVSKFFVSSFWGRCLGPFIAPLSAVALSYLSKANIKINKKVFIILFVVGYIPILFMIAASLFIGPFFTKIFYGSYYESVKKYIFIASSGILLGYATDLVTPLIITSVDVKKILIVQIIYLLLYLIFAFVGAFYYHIIGFCFGLLFANICKGIIYFMIGYKVFNKSAII